MLLSLVKPRDTTLITLQSLSPSTSPTVHLPLIEKEILSHDTRRFRFALPSPVHILGLPVGQHLSLRYTEEETGKVIIRSYTPVTSDDTKGYVDLIIKVYFKNVHPKFPDGGKMSQYLDQMTIGQTIEISGPKGKLTYMGKGELHIKHRIRDPVPEIRKSLKIGMIAGGTGITPMLQIIRRALQDPEDKTEFSLLLANQTPDDILCRQEIETMAIKHEKNIKYWYTVDRADKTWKYATGFVTAEMIKKYLPAPASDVQILMCGPPPMLKFAVLPALEELGFTPDQYFSF
ncbi:unnamed protein product [Peronospora belbahrii]|uniref:NADH-cytochrome b5 reductase n=1 Tax=Peronospora belbahrii TaxID=622444 RepID=A0AAU9KR29_9STRA|nr:unnamed protein product [Peronospora belbahrii]